MKYFIIIISLLMVITIGVLGYLMISNRPNQVLTVYHPSSEMPILESEIAKLKNETAELKDSLAKQYAFIKKMKEDNLANSARIITLEKELQNTAAIIQAFLLDKNISSDSSMAKSDPFNKPMHLLDPLLNQIMSGEIFKDPQFAKVFQEQIIEAIKTIQENEQKEGMSRFKEQLQQRLTKRIDDFAKTLTLNDYQQQEFTRILSDGGNKTIDLFSQFREQKLSAEEFRIKRETLRAESNDKVKQVLLPDQYEQYQKAESSLFRGIMPGLGRNSGGNPPQATPSPGPGLNR